MQQEASLLDSAGFFVRAVLNDYQVSFLGSHGDNHANQIRLASYLDFYINSSLISSSFVLIRFLQVSSSALALSYRLPHQLQLCRTGFLISSSFVLQVPDQLSFVLQVSSSALALSYRFLISLALSYRLPRQLQLCRTGFLVSSSFVLQASSSALALSYRIPFAQSFFSLMFSHPETSSAVNIIIIFLRGVRFLISDAGCVGISCHTSSYHW